MYFVVNVVESPIDDKPSDISKSNPNNVKQGTILGSVLNSDITAHINGYAIPSWNVKGKTVVSADDLKNYGFNATWNDTARTLSITFDKNKKMTPIDFPKSAKRIGSFQWNYLATNIRTYVAGNEITAYNASGKTLIDIEDLAVYGNITWDAANRAIILVTK